jgi:uncharacterized protein YndB with AHSA1/START domain
MPDQTDTLSVRHALSVGAPPDRAFDVFTTQMGSWWPLATYSTGEQPATDAIVEPREGGRWYERAADGSESDWGRVLAWDPPHRLVLGWQLSADFRPDPAILTEVEVRFSAEDGGSTRVELEHRGLEAYAERAEEMRAIFGSPQGWGGLLESFGAAAGG